MPRGTVNVWHERRGANRHGLPCLGLRRSCVCMGLVVMCGVVTLGGGGVLLVAGRWLLQHPGTRCHDTETLDQRCKGWNATERSGDDDSIVNKESPFSRLFNKTPSMVAGTRGTASTVHAFIHHLRSSDSQPQEENLAQRLQRLLTKPTASCKKVIRVGGRSCLGAYDGSKLVCLDEGAGVVPKDCLVYSFGVGNDFTFDTHMQDLGCEVHAFDHDNDHEIYDHRLGPTAFFHKARIGAEAGYTRFCDVTTCNPLIHYLTLADITESLGHRGRRLAYLKMDIEGEEWKVLQQVMRYPPAAATLATTTQLSLEIHLELNGNKTLEEKKEQIASYLSVLSSLSSLGFRLLNYEENELNPMYEEIDGTRLGLYAEILFINTNHSILFNH